MRGEEELLRQIEATGIEDRRVLETLRQVPRAGFVPPEMSGRAYNDDPIPIGQGQVTTQPSLVARMVESLGLPGSERVLEIGAGFGFQTALLCHLADFVWSVKYFADVAERERSNLVRHGVENV